jgi:hypothetical protein
MYKLKIFDQEEHGVIHDIDTAVNIKFGNVFGCEIFFEGISGANSADILLEFKVSEMGIVTFEALPNDVHFYDGKLVLLDTEYKLPLYFEIANKKVALGTKKDVASWVFNNNVHELINRTDGFPTISFDTFDDSEKLHGVFSLVQPYWLSLQIKLRQFMRGSYAWLTGKYQQNKFRFSIIFGLGLLAIGSIAFILVYEYSSAKEEHAVDTRLSKVATLKRTLARHNYLNLWLENMDNGKFELDGVLMKDTEVSLVKKDFAGFSDIINIHVYQKTSLINLINLSLKEANLGRLVASYDDVSHRVMLSGVITDFNKLDDIEIELNTKLPGVGDISTSGVYDYEQVSKDLEQLISVYQKSGNLTVENQILSNWQLNISGYLAEDDLQNFKKSLNELQNKYPILQIKTSLQDILSAVPFKIETVYTGDPAYIELADGRKIFSGGLVDGFRIVAIDESQIILDGKLNITIPLHSLIGYGDRAPDSLKGQAGRNYILHEEFTKERDALKQEKTYSEKLQQLKNSVNDQQMLQFIDKQINDINEDIVQKQKDLLYYEESK